MGFLRKLFNSKKKLKNEEVASSEINSIEKVKEYSASSYAVYGTEVDPIYLQSLDCDLVPGEIILLDWLVDKVVEPKFPDYFALLYGLNPEDSVNRLLVRGLVRYSTPFEALRSLKVGELKKILESYGLSKSGRKQELIDKIISSISESDIAKDVQSSSYILTDTGNQLLKEYSYIPQAHKKRGLGLSVAEIIEYIENREQELIGIDIITEFLLKKLKQSIEDKNFSIVRNCFLSLAKINYSNNDIKSCVIAYLCMFICDVSGWANNGDYHENNIFDEYSATIAPRLIGKKIDMDNLRDAFDEAWGKVSPIFPKHYLGKELTYECLIAGFNDDTETIRRLLNLDNRKKRDYRSYKI